ncbi:hypothetical protein [Atopococcus tabaci]|uniref:hypothetical protein n=1 Tax=Atopococcus tabaci TaxID=269774 RepID=UPI00040C13B4|nr:hypothetical protein [Atopococcus tabaci]
MTQNIKTASLPGASDTYRIHPDAKKYTLRDNGFTETKSGKFQLVRILGTMVSDPHAPKLKITISKDLSDLKFSTTTANGLQPVNIYKNDKFSEYRESVEAVFYGLLEGKVLERVN